ncbi:kinase-like domain-containing protein [Jimgerdemannia flammicorona]|uniref:Kinase-like domain-containing protein n=1 Tax=Jimgerdemannia flammicorona TaxID=994334 RepID=A0A433QF80_9FUNG|nr:kinase-like domain-containing protein [Jimgerdemannia flammicorona]
MTNMHTNTNTQNEVDPNDNPTSFYSVRCLSPGNVEQGKLIGRGGYGHIYKGILDKTTTVVIKKVPLEMGKNDTKMPEELKMVIMKETKILARLRKCNIVIPVIGYYFTKLDPGVWIVMEYAKNGDLMNFARKGYLKGLWLLKAKMCAEIAEALHEVHKLGIFHGDMKASNILIDLYLKTKFADFGISKTLSSIGRDSQPGHTLRWTAPERFLKEKKNMTREQLVFVDVYGYGMLVWEVVTDGKRPYDDHEEVSVYRKKLGAAISKPSEDWNPLEDVGNIPNDVPEVFGVLIQQCLAVEPSRRPPLVSIKSSLDSYLATAALSSTVAQSSNSAQTALSETERLTLISSSPSIRSTPSPEEDMDNEWLQIIVDEMADLEDLELEILDNEQKAAVEAGIQYFRWQKFDQTIQFFRQLNVDNPLYSRIVGLCYRATGDKKESFKHFKAAAKGEDIKGQYYVAWCYDHGYGVQPNKVEAFNWYSRSAEKGSVNAIGALRNIRWLDQFCEFVTHDSNGAKLSWLNNVFTPGLSDDFVKDIEAAAKMCNDAQHLLDWLNEKQILNKDGELADWFWVEDKGEG